MNLPPTSSEGIYGYGYNTPQGYGYPNLYTSPYPYQVFLPSLNPIPGSPLPAPFNSTITSEPIADLDYESNSGSQIVTNQKALCRTTGFRPPVRKKYSSGDVVMWSSCRDGENAGEVQAIGEVVSRGAMTYVSVFFP